MYCPNCNLDIEDGKFCIQCGSKLVEKKEPMPEMNLSMNKKGLVGDVGSNEGSITDNSTVVQNIYQHNPASNTPFVTESCFSCGQFAEITNMFF